MDIKRFRSIIKFSTDNSADVSAKVRKFRTLAGIENDADVLDIFQIARPVLWRAGYQLFEIPLGDNEIGALCYKKSKQGYVVINSSLPRVNINFALAHELYHVLFLSEEYVTTLDFTEEYYESEEEFAANLFAGILLMPGLSYTKMFRMFIQESDQNINDAIYKLMAYYKVPYMAALIRCYELGLCKANTIDPAKLSITRQVLKKELMRLWLDETIIDSPLRDDSERIIQMVKDLGEKYVEDEFLDQSTLDKNLANIKKLSCMVKGE